MGDKYFVKRELAEFFRYDGNLDRISLDKLVAVALSKRSKGDFIGPINIANILVEHGQYDHALKFYCVYDHPEDLVYMKATELYKDFLFEIEEKPENLKISDFGKKKIDGAINLLSKFYLKKDESVNYIASFCYNAYRDGCCDFVIKRFINTIKKNTSKRTAKKKLRALGDKLLNFGCHEEALMIYKKIEDNCRIGLAEHFPSLVKFFTSNNPEEEIPEYDLSWIRKRRGLTMERYEKVIMNYLELSLD
ncbi:hypothetical protein DRJ17_01680 [Candidatus Woesearchaeota archaeon]|nr:MAG: hypothetical protein DRJ17_01680 [Candidatus Woesearchaeota archaeon]